MEFKYILKKNFVMVVIGQIISLFGNQIIRFALPLYLLNETGSPGLYGFVQAFSAIPSIILSPIGGLIADRVDKRKIMVYLDFSTAVLFAIVMVLLGRVNLILVVGVSLFLLFAIQGIYQPAVQASIPSLVSDEGIMPANSVINLVSSAASLVGPMFGGIFLANIGIFPILYISMGCFFASAILEIFIKIPFTTESWGDSILKTAKSDLKISLRYIFKQQPCVWMACVIIALVNLVGTSLITIGLPVICKTNFFPNDIEYSDKMYTLAMIVMGVGYGIGAVIAGGFSHKIKLSFYTPLLFLCAMQFGIIGLALFFPIPVMAQYVILVICCFFMSMFAVMFMVLMLGNLQIITPDSIVGKVIGCAMAIGTCATPIGSAMYGGLFQGLGDLPYIMFFFALACCIGIGIFSIKAFKALKIALDKVAAEKEKEKLSDSTLEN